MVCDECINCRQDIHWEWVEAFSKFGFNDGDGMIGTWLVADILARKGYALNIGKWGVHNIMISSLRKNGTEFMPDALTDYRIGYDNPRTYLPSHIIELLDKSFPTTSVYSFP
ncbi:MAG: hypothetical protein ACRBB3_09155 [Alphaproteobacteria bacterium]